MGMYDTINGEQVKCFSWVSLYKEAITYHGGDLEYYGDGDDVPYRRPHYNYGKNFVIYDLNIWSGNEVHFTIHVIEEGKVKATYENEIGPINWDKNSYVISNYGILLKIHSDEDLIAYRKAYRKYVRDCEKINEHMDELFSELTNEMQEIAKANPDKKKSRTRRLTEIYAQIEHEEDLNREEKKKIEAELSYWYLDVTDIGDCILLGEYISAFKIDCDETKEICRNEIKALLAADHLLAKKYIRWQGDDVFIRDFI